MAASCDYTFMYCKYLTTVEPPSKELYQPFCPCKELVLFSEVKNVVPNAMGKGTSRDYTFCTMEIATVWVDIFEGF